MQAKGLQGSNCLQHSLLGLGEPVSTADMAAGHMWNLE